MLIQSSLFAQVIKVIDGTTLEPIALVAIFNLDRTHLAKSDEKGMADLSEFANGELLEFQHPSYKNLVITLEDALESGTIRLIEEIISIDEVVISANKWQQSSSDIPNSIVSIQQRDISFNNPQTAADALENSGQVFVQKSQLGGGSPMIRGFAANAVLITIDGIRMNNAIFRSGNLQNVINIDPNVLESAEVVLGPGSVIYGSDALGGVMNFNVKRPLLSSNNAILFKGTGYLRYSSANNEKTGHLNFNLGNKKISWLSAFTFSEFDDLKTGSKRTDKFPDYGTRTEYVIRQENQDVIVPNDDENIQVFSGYEAFNTVQRLKFRPRDFYDITYSFYYSTTSDIPRYDRLIEYKNGVPSSADWYYGPQKWMMNSLDFSLYNPSQIYNKMRVLLASQRFVESRNDRDFMSNELRQRTENVDVWTLNIDLEKDWSNENKLFYGFEITRNDVTSEAEAENIETGAFSAISTRYPDGGSKMSSLAAYGSYKIQLSDKRILSAGLRYSYVYLNSKFVDKTFYNFPFDEITLNNGALTGNLGFVYKITSNWQIDLLASTGFRSPNVDDVGKVFDSEPGNVVVPNEDLGPEYALNAEATVTKIIPEAISLSLTGFYTRLAEAMERRDYAVNGQDSIVYDGVLSNVQALVNIGKANIYGGSFDLKIDLSDHILLSSSLTIMDGQDIDEDIPLRHTTPLFGRTSLVFRGSKYRIDLFARYQGPKAFEDLAPSEQNKTHLYTSDGSLAWTTLNIKASWQPLQYLQVNGGIENILDSHYRPFSSGISAPGRNFIVAMRGSF